MAIEPTLIPEMIHWYEGMLLLPEHFRAAGRRQELLSGYLAQVAAPYGWGVRRLEHEIVGPVFRITRVEAVMPDGLLVAHDAGAEGAAPIEIDMADFALEAGGKGRMLIHLVVPVLQPRFFGQDEAEAGGLARYASARGRPLEIADPDRGWDAAADAPHERPWLRPILRLHATAEGHPAPRHYAALPVARIRRDALSQLSLDRYEPPRSLIGGATLMIERARAVAAELDAKSTYMKEKLKRVRTAPMVDAPSAKTAPKAGGEAAERAAVLGALNAEMRLLRQRVEAIQQNVDGLQALVRTLPRLQLLLADPTTHPQALYAALHDVAGDIALIGGELSLPPVKAYDHADALAGFDAVAAHILRILAVLGQRYTVIPFERVKDGRFELSLAPGQLGHQFVLGAVRLPSESVEGVRHWMKNAVIGTINHKGDIKRMRVHGAARREIERDRELDLEAPTLTTLFEVDASGASVSDTDRTLFVEHLPEDAPTAISLYAPIADAEETPAAAP